MEQLSSNYLSLSISLTSLTILKLSFPLVYKQRIYSKSISTTFTHNQNSFESIIYEERDLLDDWCEKYRSNSNKTKLK